MCSDIYKPSEHLAYHLCQCLHVWKWPVSPILCSSGSNGEFPGWLYGCCWVPCCYHVAVPSLWSENLSIYSVLGGIDRTGNMTELFRRKEKEYKLIHVLGTLWDLPPLVAFWSPTFCLSSPLGGTCGRCIKTVAAPEIPVPRPTGGPSESSSFLFLFLLYYLSFSVLTSSYFLPATKMIGNRRSNYNVLSCWPLLCSHSGK